MNLRSFIEENQDELTLISGAKFGDRQCIKELFERYEPLVKNSGITIKFARTTMTTGGRKHGSP